MAKEFLPDSPQEIPVVVSIREKKIVAIDLADWLNEGESLNEGDVSVSLKDRLGDEVAGGAVVQQTTSPGVSIVVDWTKAEADREYYLWVTMSRGGRSEDGYLRFRTHAA